MKINRRTWFSIIMLAFFGQVAWCIENMYFNVFVFKTITSDPNIIALMVALSAISATLTTLLIGTLSDKIGKRKVFISLGYILWGISIMGFCLIKVDLLKNIGLGAQAVAVASGLVVFGDCIMTFFGSSANDACFNAWVTDLTTEKTRGKVEGVIAIMPLIAMLFVFGLLDSITQKGNWNLFFLIIGGLVIIGGIISLFIVEETNVAKNEGAYFKNIFHGFKPSVIRENKMLYILLIAFMIFNICIQVFMPYFIIYLQYYLKLDNYVLIMAPAIILASVVTVFYGRLLDKYSFVKLTIIATSLLLIGVLLLFLFTNTIFVFIGSLLMMTGNLTITTCLSSRVRKYTPNKQVGLFQGIRMLFYVMLPMIIGPFIGSSVIIDEGLTYIDLGVTKVVPSPSIFLASAICLLFIIIPFIFLFKMEKEVKINE